MQENQNIQVQEILKSVGYPTDILVLDFESYFDQDYSLSKMSTIEYICDSRFDFTGIGWKILAFSPSESNFVFKPYIGNLINVFKNYYGKNLEGITVVAKNCKFDMTILSTKFGIIPPYIIDIDDLLRHYDARMSHKMRDVAPMFGLQAKGDTMQFKGLHYEEMDDETKKHLAEYCSNDVEIEMSLFKILLPQITNPKVEIPIMRHTLQLYLEPKFKFDMPDAYLLAAQMQEELDQAMQKVEWVQEYAAN